MSAQEHVTVLTMPVSASQETIDALVVEKPVKGTKAPKRFSFADMIKFQKTDLPAMLAEFVGTCFFVFLALATVQSALTGDQDIAATPMNPLAVLVISTAFGLGLAVSIAMVGNISGGHLNPAVSIALTASGLMPIPKMIMYVIGQMCGASLGAWFVQIITPGPLLGYNAVSAPISVGNAFLAEVLLTCVLVLTVFKTAVDQDMDAGFAPLLIGLSVWVIHLVGIPIDGTSVNPARSFGASAVSGNWDNHWVFWFGPIVGGLLAMFLYNFFLAAMIKAKKN